jgi:hypothetical protein
MRTRTLSESEKRDVIRAAMEVLKAQNPGCAIKIIVEDETDSRGVPQYTALIQTIPARAGEG